MASMCTLVTFRSLAPCCHMVLEMLSVYLLNEQGQSERCCRPHDDIWSKFIEGPQGLADTAARAKVRVEGTYASRLLVPQEPQKR